MYNIYLTCKETHFNHHTSLYPNYKHITKLGNQRWQIPRPATCQCLTTFTPLKSKTLIFFREVISLLARVFIFLIDRAQNIWKKLSVQFLRYTPLNCYPRCLLTMHDVTYERCIFLSRVHWPTGSMYAKVCNDSLNITIVMGSQVS